MSACKNSIQCEVLLTLIRAEVVVVAWFSHPRSTFAGSSSEHRSGTGAAAESGPVARLTRAWLRRADVHLRPLRPIAVH